jgi:hypothetical protein
VSKEGLTLLGRIFEGTYPTNFGRVDMRHGAPSKTTPKMAVSSFKAILGPDRVAAPEPSFPYHTDASRRVYEKALKLIKVHPLEPAEVLLKKALMAAGVTPVVDITPEDAYLLKMAIEIAQNGPPSPPVTVGSSTTNDKS